MALFTFVKLKNEYVFLHVKSCNIWVEILSEGNVSFLSIQLSLIPPRLYHEFIFMYHVSECIGVDGVWRMTRMMRIPVSLLQSCPSHPHSPPWLCRVCLMGMSGHVSGFAQGGRFEGKICISHPYTVKGTHSEHSVWAWGHS